MFNYIRELVQEYRVLVVSALLLLGKVVVFLAINDSLTSNERVIFSLLYGLLWLTVIIFTLSPGILLGRTKRAVFLFSVSVALSMLFVLDSWYYRGYGMFISCYTLNQTSNLEGLWASIISMARASDALYFIDVIALYFVLRFVPSTHDHSSRKVTVFFTVFFVSVMVILSANYLHQQYRSNPLFYSCFVQNKTMHNLSPIAFHAWDCYEYLTEEGAVSLDAQDSLAINSFYASQIDTVPSPLDGIFAGMNLICLQVESLENFVIGQSYDQQSITPRLNRLLDHALYFPNFYEQVANGTSSDADLLINTSLYPPRKGCAFFRCANNSYRSLPLMLKELGYCTTAIKADKASYYNWKMALLHMGFDKCIDADSFQKTDMIGAMPSDSSILFQSLEFIKTQTQPFYSFVVTETSHSPFDLPEQKRNLALPPSIHGSILADYLQSIHYVDKQIGAFVDALDSRGMLENTVLVIYGDHCGVHKYYDDQVQRLKQAPAWCRDNSERVPLIIYQKKLASQRVLNYGGQVDVLPTLAPLMGIHRSRYQSSAMGQNLLGSRKNYCVLTNGRCVGDSTAGWHQEEMTQLLNLSDKLIRSAYFGRK